jgi:hypothetical protein
VPESITVDNLKVGVAHWPHHPRCRCRRSAAKQVTGEWIVYGKHEGDNYYQGIGIHGDDP